MDTFHIALWIAVAINVAASAFQIRMGCIYRRRIQEIDEMMHDLQNVHALLKEHMPVASVNADEPDFGW
jgi:hypothetical protein